MARTALAFYELARGQSMGVFISERRAQAKLSRAAVARAAKVSNETVRKIEAGSGPGTSFQVMGRLASVLAFSLDDLQTHISEAADE